MPPYRGTGQRRSGRGHIDHDVLEGLPVRHWRRQKVSVAGPTKNENAGRGNGQSELPMPKDAHLLCQMSQALLQAARAGRVNRPSPSGEEEVKAVVGEDEDGGAGAGVGRDEGEKAFMAVRWQIVPRHLEGPEVEYLAKRRKVTRSRNGGLPAGVVMKRVTVRRVDLEGNSVVEDILVADGQPIDGEVLAEVAVVTDTVGTMVDGVGVVNADGVVVLGDGMLPTPPRRRPPPPKRKPKGPGRGRKKKVQFASGREGPAGIVVIDDGVIQPATGQAAVSGAEVVKVDDTVNGTKVKESEDTEMVDDSNLPEDEGEVEEEEEGEEGEEGEEMEDDDREEGELSPSPEPKLEPEPQPPPRSMQSSASPTKPMPIPMPRKYSSGVLHLNPTGLTHPLPPKPGSALFFTPKPASRPAATLPHLQAGSSDHQPVNETREPQQADPGPAQPIEQPNNAVVTDQPVIESSTSAIEQSDNAMVTDQAVIEPFTSTTEQSDNAVVTDQPVAELSTPATEQANNAIIPNQLVMETSTSAIEQSNNAIVTDQAVIESSTSAIELSVNAVITDPPVVESSTSAINITQSPPKERPDNASNIEVVERLEAVGHIGAIPGLSKGDDITREETATKDNADG